MRTLVWHSDCLLGMVLHSVETMTLVLPLLMVPLVEDLEHADAAVMPLVVQHGLHPGILVVVAVTVVADPRAV